MRKLRSTGNERSKKIIPPLAGVFILLVIWQTSVVVMGVPKYILPSPSGVATALAGMIPEIVPDMITTLEEALTGFLLSILLAFVLVFLMDTFSILKATIYPLLTISQMIPIIALAPLFILWFGFGMLPKVLVVILVCFFPVAINLSASLEAVDPDMISLFKSMKASRWKIFSMLKLPASLIGLFSGLRIAAAYSIMGAVIGEWLGGSEGLGVYMQIARKSFLVDKVFAAAIIIVILSLIVFMFITFLEKIIMPWKIQ